MRVMIGIPAYDGSLHVDTTRSLLNEQAAAISLGVEIEVVFIPGCSVISMARNQIAAKFLESDADKLVFIDSDVSWEVGSILKLAARPVDFVGGAYRLKQELEAYPVGWLDKPELHAVNGLLEVENVPGGFCCLTRDVFAKLKEALPRPYGHYEFEGQAYWHSPYMNGRLYGEDAAFCHDWRSIGGDVWLDPELNLTHHAGATAYKGHIGQWLKTRN